MTLFRMRIYLKKGALNVYLLNTPTFSFFLSEFILNLAIFVINTFASFKYIFLLFITLCIPLWPGYHLLGIIFHLYEGDAHTFSQSEYADLAFIFLFIIHGFENQDEDISQRVDTIGLNQDQSCPPSLQQMKIRQCKATMFPYVTRHLFFLLLKASPL